LEGLETHDALKEFSGLTNLSGDFSVSVLAKSNWRVNTFMHVLADLSGVVFGGHELVLIRLDVSLIEGVLEVVLTSVIGTPFLNGNELIREHVVTVDLNQLSVVSIGDTTSIIGISN